jgi:hypothetical protein
VLKIYVKNAFKNCFYSKYDVLVCMFIRNYLCCFSLGVYSSELHIHKKMEMPSKIRKFRVNRNAFLKGKLAREFHVEFFFQLDIL